MKIKFSRLYNMYHHLKYGKLGHQTFDFCEINSDLVKNHKIKGCGSSGCAMGELPIIDSKRWKFGDIKYSYVPQLIQGTSFELNEDVANYFGISTEMVSHLFYPNYQICEMYGGKELNVNANKEQVANNILAFIDRMAKDAA